MTYDFDDVSAERRRTMQAIGSKDTGPELKAKAAMDALGLGYDEHPRYGRFQPDFVLDDGTVVQVMGCFWHRCPCQREYGTPDSNEDYWDPKFRDNVERDKRRRRVLLQEHDVPFVFWVWECQDIPAKITWLANYRELI